MPVLTRECLARRLQENWKARHPKDADFGVTDDSLTNLGWLQQLNIMKLAAPPGADTTAEQRMTYYSPTMQVNPNAILNMTGSGDGVADASYADYQYSQVSGSPMLQSSPIAAGYRGTLHDTPCTRDPKTDPAYKPPYHYSELISMAISESKKKKLSLSGIYEWIKKNFAYYRHAEPSWQNSIRHNLSLNKCFEKVPRRKDEPGKGGFWRINPEYENLFVNGVYKSKRRTTATINTAPYYYGTASVARREMQREQSLDDDDSESSSSGSSNNTRADNSPMLTSAANLVANNVSDSAHTVQSLGFIQVKREPHDDNEFHVQGKRDPLYDSHEWNTLLTQDIMVGGVTVKAEDIIDGGNKKPVSPSHSITSPESDTNSDDIDDFFQMIDLDKLEWEGFPHDQESGGPLDLTIVGTSINRPSLWPDLLHPLDVDDDDTPRAGYSSSRLSTPVRILDELDSFDPLSDSNAQGLNEALAALSRDHDFHDVIGDF